MRIFSFLQSRAERRSGIPHGTSDRARLLGLPVFDAGWPEMLEKAETALRLKGERTEIFFLDDATLTAALTNRHYRSWIADQILLPSRGGIFGFLNMLIGRRSVAGFTPDTLVPAILTYIERPLKVLLIGEGGPDGQQLQVCLQEHAPWHRVVTATVDRLQTMPAVDLVIVTKQHLGVTDRVRLSAVSASLVIFAGKGLRRLAESSKPTSGRFALLPATSVSDSKAA